jgi:hypothetical protein
MNIIFKANKFSFGFRRKKWMQGQIVDPAITEEEYFEMQEKKHFDAVSPEAKKIEKKYYESIKEEKYDNRNLEELTKLFLNKFKKDVPRNMKNNTEWIIEQLNKEEESDDSKV